MIKNSKQAWIAGQQVNVGFLKGLTVIAAVATPGDYAPDAYVLVRGAQFYSFVPHNGLTKLSESEAVEMVEEGKRVRAAMEAKAAKQADAAIRAVSLASRLMAA